MNSSATPRLTSASRSDSRISPRATSRCSSVSLPWPRRFLKARWSFSVRDSNIRFAIQRHCSKRVYGSRGGQRSREAKKQGTDQSKGRRGYSQGRFDRKRSVDGLRDSISFGLRDRGNGSGWRLVDYNFDLDIFRVEVQTHFHRAADGIAQLKSYEIPGSDFIDG